MKFVNDINVALAWKVDVQPVTDWMKDHEYTGEWGVYAHFLTKNSWDHTVLIKSLLIKTRLLILKGEFNGVRREKVNIKGELEIDHKRGVIYFHTSDENRVTTFGGVTILRICNLPKPIPHKFLLDITHMRGQNWR